MKRYTVMLCCNDERGMPTGRVEQIQIEDEIHLEHGGRGLALGFGDEMIRISGRHRFAASGYMTCVGNVFWDAVGMETAEAKRLVEHLLSTGWTVVEHADRGPFAALARKERA
jgi:hypothetical protein